MSTSNAGINAEILKQMNIALIVAAKYGNLSYVEKLIEQGADPSYEGDEREIQAAVSRVTAPDVPSVESLPKRRYVQRADDGDAKLPVTAHRTTALHAAVQCPNHAITDYLLKKGASFNIKNKDNKTVVELINNMQQNEPKYRIKQDFIESVEFYCTNLLKELKASKDNKTKMEELAKYLSNHMYHLCDFSDQESSTLYQFLLECLSFKPNILNAESNQKLKNMLLITTAQRGDFTQVKALIQQGASPKYEDEKYSSNAFIWAASRGYIPVVGYLLDNGYNTLDERSHRGTGCTALHEAVKYTKPVMMDYLLENGANFTIKNKKDNKTAFELIRDITLTEQQVKFTQRFITSVEFYCATLTKKLAKPEENKQIMEKIKNYLTNNLSLLCEFSVNSVHIYNLLSSLISSTNILTLLDQKQNFYNELLMIATRRGDLKLLKELIQKDADPNYVDKEFGLNAFSWAASNGNTEIVNYFIDFYINVQKGHTTFDPKKYNFIEVGHTALHYAASQGRAHIIQLLVNAGLDINHKMSNGKTLMDRLLKNGFVDCLQLCLSLGIFLKENITEDIQKYAKSNKDKMLVVVRAAEKLFKFSSQDDKDSKEFEEKHINELLSQLGNGINARNAEGNTALFNAVIHKKIFLFAKLLEAGANITLLNNNKNTLYDLINKIEDRQTQETFKHHLMKRLENDCKRMISEYRQNDYGLFNRWMLHNLPAIFDLSLDSPTLKNVLQYLSSPFDEKIAKEIQDLKNKSLIKSIKIYDIKLFKEMLLAGAEAKLIDEETQYSMLMLAVRKGHIDMVDYLITNKYYSTNELVMDKNGKTALNIAALNNDIKMLDYLVISQGLVLDNEPGLTRPWYWAASAGSREVFRHMVEKYQLDINKRNEVNGDSLLLTAVRFKNVQAVQFLLEHGAYIDQKHPKNETIRGLVEKDSPNNPTLPILVAAQELFKIIKEKKFFFLQQGFFDFYQKIDIKNAIAQLGNGLNAREFTTGDTALHLATKENKFKIIRLLLDADADVFIKNRAGQAPYDILCQCKDPYILLSIRIKKFRTFEGIKPLDMKNIDEFKHEISSAFLSLEEEKEKLGLAIYHILSNINSPLADIPLAQSILQSLYPNFKVCSQEEAEIELSNKFNFNSHFILSPTNIANRFICSVRVPPITQSFELRLLSNGCFAIGNKLTFNNLKEVIQHLTDPLIEAVDQKKAKVRAAFEELRNATGDRESSIGSRSESQRVILNSLKLIYAEKFKTMGGVEGVLQNLRKYLEEQFLKKPPSYRGKALAMTFDAKIDCEEVRIQYFLNYYHTAWRYIKRPNEWISQETRYAVRDSQNRVAFANIPEHVFKEIAYLWLAASDNSIKPIRGMTVEGMMQQFIEELAFMGRAHNWDWLDGIKESSEKEALRKEMIKKYGRVVDDLKPDNPTCSVGTNQRLLQSINGHPLTEVKESRDLSHATIKSLVQDRMTTRFNEFLAGKDKQSIQKLLAAFDRKYIDIDPNKEDEELLASFKLSQKDIIDFRNEMISTYPLRFEYEPFRIDAKHYFSYDEYFYQLIEKPFETFSEVLLDIARGKIKTFSEKPQNTLSLESDGPLLQWSRSGDKLAKRKEEGAEIILLPGSVPIDSDPVKFRGFGPEESIPIPAGR